MKAYDLNDAGVIVGYYYTTAGEQTPFYFQDGVAHSIDAALSAIGLSTQRIATGINNQNVICGGGDDATGKQNAWTYDIGTCVATLLGTVGDDNCGAGAINQSGQTIGRGKYTTTPYMAVTYDGTWHIVDAAETRAQWGHDINDQGRMVGTVYIGSNNYMSWYSASPGEGSMVEVSIAGWQSVNVRTINEHDRMAGYGRPPGAGVFEKRGFIIRPPVGDGDHDGDIDASDFAQMMNCLSGPKEASGFTPPAEACLVNFDFAPAEGDIDLVDFASFQVVFEGS
jgi:hypothetical protein